MAVNTPSALSNIRVLEIALGVNTPYAGTVLGEFGAEVIKIEQRAGDPGRTNTTWAGVRQDLAPGRTCIYEHTNTNKRGMTINLKHPKGKEVFHRLIERSDVFLNAYRPRTAKSLGVDYETLSKLNPRLIYGVSSAYGQQGPDGGVAGFDYTGMARSGFMFTIGTPEMPPMTSSGVIVDTMGATLLALGVLVALEAREQTGIGQRVDSSLLLGGMQLARFDIYTALNIGEQYERFDRKRAHNALWNYYQCKDDEWLMLAMPFPDPFWPKVCDILGIPDLGRDPRYLTFEQRFDHREVLVTALDQAFLKRDRKEWLGLLKEADCSFSTVAHIADLSKDEQATANGYVFQYDHPSLGKMWAAGPPAKLSRTPATFRIPAPLLGEHNKEVLTQVCGYSEKDAEELQRVGAV